MAASLKSHSEGQTMVLTISNPDHRNALGPEMYAAGVEALNAAESNPDVRSVVICGDGAHFCAGGNLQRLLGNRDKGRDVQAASIDGLHSWIETIRSSSKPVIAAVEGACAGAGFSLALTCDLIVAARNAVFVMAYSNVGLSPDGGATWSIPHLLPRATAMRLLLLGDRCSSDELERLGVVSAVCDPGEAVASALGMAERVNGRAPNTLASIKELVNDAPATPLHAHLNNERDHFVRNLFHDNGGEGISAFLEKRTPRYR
ncbi:oxepin-CoA hydrolase, alternative type [Hydrogenophaga sp. 5NK40-0174]|uniref:oxepin-CoA hydrolase, alternative type n=1 Tax=Hydrogenophaga sp. 5NK40-0174 TaxID=3127649 RepID=UPI0031030DDD